MEDRTKIRFEFKINCFYTMSKTKVDKNKRQIFKRSPKKVYGHLCLLYLSILHCVTDGSLYTHFLHSLLVQFELMDISYNE